MFGVKYYTDAIENLDLIMLTEVHSKFSSTSEHDKKKSELVCRYFVHRTFENGDR